VCFDFPYNFFSANLLILRGIQQDIVINVHMPSCEVPAILVSFQSNINYPNKCPKKSRIHLDRLQNKYTNYKGIKNNTNFGQITGIQEKLDKTCK